MAEESLIPNEPDQNAVPALMTKEARATANVSVDRRARRALEFAASVSEPGPEGRTSSLALSRQLRTIADACTEATILAHGLIGRVLPSAS